MRPGGPSGQHCALSEMGLFWGPCSCYDSEGPSWGKTPPTPDGTAPSPSPCTCAVSYSSLPDAFLVYCLSACRWSPHLQKYKFWGGRDLALFPSASQCPRCAGWSLALDGTTSTQARLRASFSRSRSPAQGQLRAALQEACWCDLSPPPKVSEVRAETMDDVRLDTH